MKQKSYLLMLKGVLYLLSKYLTSCKEDDYS